MQAALTPELLSVAKGVGVTRLADITGLDIAGLPVVQAVRPFSLSNAISQGKGATLAQAAVSAIFESAESFFAERLDRFNVVWATAKELAVPLERFRLHLLDGVPHDWADWELPWIEATNLLDARVGLVPLELVHTAYVYPMPRGDGVFAASTTGLAASFRPEDAILHGMMECIERDAIARARTTHGFLHRRRIDPRSIMEPRLCDLLSALGEKGFLVGLWDAPSPTGVPVIWCHVMEDREPDSALLPFPAEGSAARLDPAEAISHAIFEALQSRLTVISGARDDLTRANYPKYPDMAKISAHRRLVAEGPCELECGRPNKELKTLWDVSGVLGAVGRGGNGPVYQVRLETAPLSGIAAVKMIVPSLLPLVEAWS
jgi:YcaO-like protein with predicted kinase domain